MIGTILVATTTRQQIRRQVCRVRPHLARPRPRPAPVLRFHRDFSAAQPQPRSSVPGSVPGSVPWSSLPEPQRSAWEMLGFDSDRWEGRRPPPISMSRSWSELSPDQKAAARHGLGYTGESWDANMADNDGGWLVDLEAKDRPKPTSVPAGPLLRGRKDKDGAATSTSGAIASTAWNVASGVAKVLAPTLVDSLSGPVVVDDVETTVYLDDSPSMNESMGGWFGSTRLEEGKKVLSKLGPLLKPRPCRVLKFSNRPTVLALRDEEADSDSSKSLALSGWNGSGVGTYLWHMIEQDVLKRYRPGGGKLRLVVVTDGEDNMSPAGYQGMGGMDPMMRTLQGAGYDIEWHIVVIGDGKGLERYEALAGATGGSFLAVQKSFDETSRDSARFFEAVESSGGEVNDERRRERQHRYESDAKKGKVDQVDWYKALPPGDKK